MTPETGKLIWALKQQGIVITIYVHLLLAQSFIVEYKPTIKCNFPHHELRVQLWERLDRGLVDKEKIFCGQSHQHCLKSGCRMSLLTVKHRGGNIVVRNSDKYYLPSPGG